MREEFGQFNEGQREAITHGKGPAIVLAGPGSGKTLVITWRVRWLIEHEGVHPANILVITFTRAAAEEMRRRFAAFPGMTDAPVSFGTFHSVFFRILRYAYRYTAANIVREDVRRSYIHEMAGELELELEDENEFVTGILGEISYIKGEMISLNLYHSSNCADELFVKFYEGYEERLRRNRFLDFDDMLVFTYELLKERPDIREMWQKKFRYILIDEFQDINKVQYEIVKMLLGEERNLFIVGDDDQSIYRFRGARPEIMLGFPKDFPDAQKVLLGVNYRCSEEIAAGAARLIGYNKKRYEKEIRAARGSMVPILYREKETVSEECADILNGIAFYYKKGIPLENMAVIFRTNTQPRLLVGRLMEYNVPFRMRDRLPNLFEHWIAKNIIAYLKLAQGARDRETFLAVMNRPKRYISRKMLGEGEVDFAALKREAVGKYWLYEKIDKLEMDLHLIEKMDVYAAITYLRNGVGYEDYITEYASFRRINPEDLFEVLNQIHETARDYGTAAEWFSYIESYTEELRRQMEAGKRPEEKGVTLTTMHSAKGLEYDVVFVMDANEGVCPHKKAVKEADIEEERRLFYVAVTRAKTYLFLYSVREMYQKKTETSRFIGELRFDPSLYREGARVVHKNLGTATIVKVTEDKITLRFDRGRKKTRTFSRGYVMEKNLITAVLPEKAKGD